MKYVYKILRISAWLLVLITLVTLFSGFLTTKYFLTPWLGYQFSNYIHTIIIPIFFVPLFFIHSLGGIFVLIGRNKILNKKVIKIIALIIWAAIFVLFGVFYLAQNPAFKTGGNGINNGANPSASPGAPTISLSVAEIQKHNSANDCWLIIGNNAYNVTSYLTIHPGGADAIVPYCGQDATMAFATKNQGVPHAQSAANFLNSFLLGAVGQQINAQTPQQIQAQTSAVNSEDEEDNDD